MFNCYRKSYVATVNTLLAHIVRGMQDEATDMLKSNPKLALAKGDITDHAGRAFEEMTALQLAVCNLDWHMWEMIFKHLPQDAAKEQVQVFGASNFIDLHDKIQAPWRQLLIELELYMNMPWDWDGAKSTKHWTTVIGGLQRQLPIHCLQEYCNPRESFGPYPNFTDEKLTRVDVLKGGGCFEFSHLGSKIALSRGGWAGPVRAGEKPLTLIVAAMDHRALITLLNRRIYQRENLISKLQARSKLQVH